MPLVVHNFHIINTLTRVLEVTCAMWFKTAPIVKKTQKSDAPHVCRFIQKTLFFSVKFLPCPHFVIRQRRYHTVKLSVLSECMWGMTMALLCAGSDDWGIFSVLRALSFGYVQS